METISVRKIKVDIKTNHGLLKKKITKFMVNLRYNLRLYCFRTTIILAVDRRSCC